MKVDKSKDTSKKILSLAGIKINGNNSWDIRVHNEGFYQRVLAQGSLGLGESYIPFSRASDHLAVVAVINK